MIQETVNRMAGNSLKMKEWCIGISSALFGLSFTTKNSDAINIVYLIVALFWFLDGYYLRLEKSFRRVFENARNTPHNQIDFCMTPDIGGNLCQREWWVLWLSSIFSFSTFILYVTIVLVAGCFFNRLTTEG